MPGNTVSKLEVKSYDSPDEQRRPDKTAIDIVTVSDFTLGRFTLEPGWTWSGCIKPVVNTDSCQSNHVGYCISGSIEIEMEDGTRSTIKAGDSYAIPPGHDARVVGDEQFQAIEFLSAAGYSGVRFDPARADIALQGVLVCEGGVAARFSENQLKKKLDARECFIEFRLRGNGPGIARFWTCDFTEGYIRINASYRT